LNPKSSQTPCPPTFESGSAPDCRDTSPMEMATKMTMALATVMAPPVGNATGAAMGGPALGHDGDDTSVAPSLP